MMKIFKKIAAFVGAILAVFTFGGAFSACTLFATMDKDALNQAACRHEYEWKTVAPTCQNEGFTAQICKKCDHVSETSKKDKKPVTGHTGVGKCPTCNLDYFAEFTAYLSKIITNYDGSAKCHTDGQKFTVGETEYYSELRYYTETSVVETTVSLYDAAMDGNVTTALTLTMPNADGRYVFTYLEDGWTVSANVHAPGVTETVVDWTMISSTYQGAPAEANAELMDRAAAWLRVTVKFIAKQYFPPYVFAFDFSHFGFSNVL